MRARPAAAKAAASCVGRLADEHGRGDPLGDGRGQGVDGHALGAPAGDEHERLLEGAHARR